MENRVDPRTLLWSFPLCGETGQLKPLVLLVFQTQWRSSRILHGSLSHHGSPHVSVSGLLEPAEPARRWPDRGSALSAGP